MEKFRETFEQINGDIVPQVLQIMQENMVLIGVAAFLLLMMYIGYRKGFFDRLLSLGSVILTLAAEIKIFPIFMDYWRENEGIHEFFLGIVGNLMHLDAEKTSSPLYALLGLDVLADNAALKMGELAAKILCFILIFILVRLALKLALVFFRGLKRIRLIDALDKWVGLIFGFTEGMIFVWLFMLVVSGFPTISFCAAVLDQITKSELLMQIYNQNLILIFIADLLT